MSHTKGSWFGRPSHDPVLIQGADEVGLSIAFACGGGDPRRHEFMANARLIAAAPDLLEAAKIALSEAESWIHDQLDGTSSLDSALKALEPVREAIARATGEKA